MITESKHTPRHLNCLKIYEYLNSMTFIFITLVYFAMNILLNQNFQLKQDSALKVEIVPTHAGPKNAY